MAAKPLTIFFSVGEPSGDLHGANLIRKLQARCPGVEAVGYGGPTMATAGCRLHADLTALAVMWFGRALLNIHKFWDLASRADRYFRHRRPDAVVLIDYPGFNWWIARRAKAHGIPVFYYTPPQIWAWAQWRVAKMRRFVDHVLCSLPFEEAWFRERGCNATFVGHPFFDEVQRLRLDAEFVAQHQAREGDSPVLGDCPSFCVGKNGTVPFSGHICGDTKTGTVPRPNGPLVTILPGSRTQEVTGNLRWFLKAAAMVREAVPDVRFAMAAFKPHQAEWARRQVAASRLPIAVHTGRTPELMAAADCCMAVSGSVSLELLYHTKPTVILYSIGRAAYFVQRFFRKVKYITLVNLLTADELYPQDLTPFDPSQPDAGKVLFPEYLTCEDKSAQIATHVIEWLRDPARRAAKVAQLAELKARVAHGGASARAAEYILDALVGRHIAPSYSSRSA